MAGQALLPERSCLAGQLCGRLALLAGGCLIDPGLEVGGFEIGEVERQVPHVAFRIDDQARDAVQQSFLDQVDAQTGLARASHPDDDSVRGEVVCFVGDQFILRGSPAEVEIAFLEFGFHVEELTAQPSRRHIRNSPTDPTNRA